MGGLRRLRRMRRERAALASSRAFDPRWYTEAYADAAGRDPVRHYLGVRDGRRPSPWFDVAWYVERYPDVAASGLDPLAHYILYGAAEGRDPNPYFATRWYAANNPDAGAAATPLDHYLAAGASERLDPSPKFDAAWYVTAHEGVAESGLDPLGHFLLVGRPAGLRAEPLRKPAPGEPVEAARLQAFKALEPVAGEPVALFAAFAPDGRLKANVKPYVEALAACGVRVVLVVATDHPFTPDPGLAALLAGGYVRENRGFDFAAWAHVMRAEPGLFGAETLFLVNDSVIGPIGQGSLAALIERVRRSPAMVVGATESREHRWHLQSYFLALKRDALERRPVHMFFRHVRSLGDKDAVIRAYEVELATTLQASGVTCEAVFPPGPAGDNRTVFDWRGLLDEGFPFVKALVLAGYYETLDIEGWSEALSARGFDPAIAEATLAARGAPAAEPKAKGALLRPADVAAPQPPWKLAFLGPWNHASGLGLAGRGYLSALWRTGARLNLHPLEIPFHTHAQLAPPFPAKDFEGAADVAVVHLNPNDWAMLTDEQRRVIDRARFRVGFWVWEMGHVPDAWRPNFDSVDAIWTPSRYCAHVFGGQTRVPIEVIPHVVPVQPRGAGGGRAAVLADLGVEPDAKLVLYAFDGASYLVRKNPFALLRAFARAGLAERGWRLVLKTKNLADWPEQARSMHKLVAATPGTVLVERQMTAEAMTALFEAADVYASPHRSEGFGLTIAEAMAAGKPVVATDFGGSRDFLDASCGYPVPAKTVVLDRTYGAYTRGGEWGEIDEAAFAQALADAAAAVERGDDALGERARARIADRLSADAVARAFEGALDRLLRWRAGAEAA